MKKSIVLLLLASLVMGGIPGSALASTNQCKKQERALNDAEKQNKKAEKAVSKQEKNITSLERKISKSTDKVQSLESKKENRYIREIEKGQKKLDRIESQRREDLVRAAELGTQIAACAASGIINGIFGTDDACPASTRNALAAELVRTQTRLANVGLATEEVRSRAERTAESKAREYDPKIRAAKQKRARQIAELAREVAKLPRLVEAAVVTEQRLDEAQAALDRCETIFG